MTLEAVEAYPLTWPAGWRRTPPASRTRARFGRREVRQGYSYASSAQLTVADLTSDATQKWILTRDDSGTYRVRNAASGQCMDVFYSSTASGALVGQYTCTGTDNQRWRVTNSGGVLTLVAQHSGLSLTAGADGLVVQANDTGAANQRWAATPS